MGYSWLLHILQYPVMIQTFTVIREKANFWRLVTKKAELEYATSPKQQKKDIILERPFCFS